MTRPEIAPPQILSLDRIDFAGPIAQLLSRGHVIHGFANSVNTRMIVVLEDREYSDEAPGLGFGAAGTAERALARALFTYARREQAGLPYIDETTFPESRAGQAPGDHYQSRFDAIVASGDFWLYQDGPFFVAGSSYGGEPSRRGPVLADVSPLDAIHALTRAYDSLAALPSIVL